MASDETAASVDNMHVATREIRIETSTVCNFRCLVCPRESLVRRQQVMATPTFEGLVAVAKSDLPQLEVCTLSGFGDFATDPDWPRKLELARKHFRQVHAVTNLSLVRDDELKFLADHTTALRVSIYGLDEHTYRRAHRPPGETSYEAVASRIRRLAAMGGTKVGVTCCETEENREQIAAWIRTWSGVVDDVEVWRPHNWIDGRSYRRRSSERVATCGRPASGPIQVQVNGTVNVCCFDYNGLMLLGDLSRQSLAEILEGPELKRVRELHADGRADELPLCAQCDQRNSPEDKRACLVYSSRCDVADRVHRTSTGMERMPDDQDS